MSSFISSLLLLIFLCHTMHGCDGRRLTVSKENHKHVHHSSKDVEKISKEKISLLKELSPARKHRKATINNEIMVNDNQINGDGARRTQKQIKHPELPTAASKDEVEDHTKQMNPAYLGSTTEISMFSDEGYLQQSTKIEGSERRRGRSVLGSLQSHFTENETVVDHSEENGDHDHVGVSKDVVDMDYEQPHKKSPIHNFSP